MYKKSFLSCGHKTPSLLLWCYCCWVGERMVHHIQNNFVKMNIFLILTITFMVSQPRFCSCFITKVAFGVKRTSLSRTLPPLLAETSGTTVAGNDLDDVLSRLLKTASEYEADALECIRTASDSKEVEVFRVAFLGKSGKVTGLMKEMKGLANSDKPKLGEVINRAKNSIEKEILEAKERLMMKELEDQIEREDIGNTFQIDCSPNFFPSPGKRHPISLVLDLTTRIFEEIGYEVIDGPENSPEIENDFFNFEALGMPPLHPARDMQDTFYINTSNLNTNDTLLLRTHTSAVQIREMEKRKPPFKIVVPGRVYRKDDVDATHFPVFHQVEILAIDEIGKLTVPHLLGTVKYFLRKMFGPDTELKYRSSYFPFTEPSIEVDVFFKGRWLEVLGCGMVDPVVLESVGLDPKKYAGFAAGFGIERFAMIMHNIQDIRLFWENNMEFLSQFPTQLYEIPGDENDEEKLIQEGKKSADDLYGSVGEYIIE